MLIKRKDPFTGQVNSLELNVTQAQLDEWKSGAFIQDVMPDLTPSEREFIMTGIWDDSWDRYVTKQEIPPQQDKIENFVNNVISKSKVLNSMDDLERIIYERNRSKINSILNPKRG
tara:strand:- start:808 stop:1155 length:348 start_codon:yes stop_codon:yes gene_type:complete